MTQEQIEAVREQLQASIDALSEPLDEIALAALDHLTKANEELRAEVEELTTTINNERDDWGGERKDLRATIDRLTKERDEAVRAAGVVDRELDRLHTRLSAMQEANDEAVRRADTETPFKTHVIVSDVVEPLRPFATKPEPEVDPLEAVRHYEAALLHAFPAGASGKVFDEWNAARTALAARGGRVVFDGREG